jgi:hypothetical protein
MAAPVFEEFDPASDCDCPGCVQRRRALPYSTTGRPPAVHRAVILAAAASTALVAGHAAPALAVPRAPGHADAPAADEPDTPEDAEPDTEADTPEDTEPGTSKDTEAPHPGPAGKPGKPPVKAPATTRADIIRRAEQWVDDEVPYSMAEHWSDGYRQDCSGFVSMAWNLPGNEWTGSLARYAVPITKEDLQPGDILLFHDPSLAARRSHVVIFGGWTDDSHTSYFAYEEARPHARRKATPYPYWNNTDRYVPYRYKGLAGGTASAEPDTGQPDNAKPGEPVATPYPGRAHFGPGADNKYVTRLGRMLVERGAGRYYPSGPGSRWSKADRRATRAFQRAQGWRGQDADGLPGPLTWELLVTGQGRDIPSGAADPVAPASRGVPGYPGRAMFRPGATNKYVTRLGKQLVRKGFGKYHTSGPGPRWDEADRRGVEAFQRAQGWRGGAADGYPGPETWRRLFS